MSHFSDATLQKFEVLCDAFKGIDFCANLRTDRMAAHGQPLNPDFRVKCKMFEGDVYLEHVQIDQGSYYTVEWHGKPQSFGFRIQPDRNIWGPYFIGL